MEEKKHNRLYDSVRWRKARIWFLNNNPLCVMCKAMGKEVAAIVVDHKIPHKGDEELFWSVDNWQSICKPCHDSAKRIKDIGGVAPGCDVDGFPLDRDHSWGKE